MKEHDPHARGEHGGSMKMEPGTMMARSPADRPWVYPAMMLLGLWLATSPTVLDYGRPALVWSDVLSGLGAIVIALLAAALPRRWAWIAFGNAFLGLWVMLAPLVFWAPSPAVFLNDTLVGALLIAFSVIEPMGMPMEGPEIPPGWTYNPSSWAQRTPIILLGLVGIFLSRVMAAFQLGYIDTLWEPFFGDGTRRVLQSEVSRSFPISDAGLGMVTYVLEVLSGLMGDKKRWRTMPWMVAMFGVVVIPLGVVSITLIILQPVVVGAWCTLCLLSAVAMLVMIPLTLDEVVAMVQFLRSSKRKGTSYWHAFWFGGTPEGTHDAPPRDREPTWSPAAMLWGFTPTWGLLLATGLGVWMMFAPSVFQTEGLMRDSGFIAGALVIVVSIIAMADVGRVTRYFNLVLGAWLVVAPWFLGGAQGWARWNAVAVGVLISLVSLPLGRWRDRYGSAEKPALWVPGDKEKVRREGPPPHRHAPVH